MFSLVVRHFCKDVNVFKIFYDNAGMYNFGMDKTNLKEPCLIHSLPIFLRENYVLVVTRLENDLRVSKYKTSTHTSLHL